MTDNDAHSLAWFRQLSSLDDRVAILTDPYAQLPTDLVRRLMARNVPVAATWWVADPSSTCWMIRPSLADALADVRARLDEWWQNGCTENQRADLIKDRREEFEKGYRPVIDAAVNAANQDPREPAIVAITAKHPSGEFRLPALLAAYVELKARDRGAH